MKYLHTKFDDLVKPYQEDLFKSLNEFVAIDSKYDETSKDEENPFGRGVSHALNYIKDLAIKDGFRATNYNNMVVEILCGEGENNLTILAHADVVPEGKGWPHDPFTVTEKDGVLTGRGVADDKGPLLETYYALKALRDNNMLGNYQVRFVVGGNEESGSLGVEHYFHTLKKKQPTIGFSPDAEFPLIYAEKGIRNFKFSKDMSIDNVECIIGGLASNSVIEECRVILYKKDQKLFDLFKDKIGNVRVLPLHNGHYQITVIGKSAHGSTPQLGINAGLLSLSVLADYYHDENVVKLVETLSDPYARGINGFYVSRNMDNQQTSLNIGIIDFRNNHIEIIGNYRYVDTCDIEKATKDIKERMNPFNVEVVGDSPLLFYKKNAELVQTLLKCYQEETGDYDTTIKAIGGGTYAKEADNIIAFGAEFPGWDSKMHGIGEGCKKADMIKAMAIYARAIKELGNKIEK